MKLLSLCLLVAMMTVPTQAETREPKPIPAIYRRIVTLGDSITDGFTYPLLIQQSLREAGYQTPHFINAGVGSDTAKGMRARLESDVIAHRPSLVMLNCGINDSNEVEPVDFEASVVSIIERLQAAAIPVMLFTTTTITSPDWDKVRAQFKGTEDEAKIPKWEEESKLQIARIEIFDATLRRLARERKLLLADAHAGMTRVREIGLNEPDGGHLNWQGYRAMVRAILDAMGFAAVAVPTVQKPPVEEGIIREWRVRAAPQNASLDAKTIAATTADENWKALQLPQSAPQNGWYWEQERMRGFALGLDKFLDPRLSDPKVSEEIRKAAPTRFQSLGIFRVRGGKLEAKNFQLLTGGGTGAVWMRRPKSEWRLAWKHPGTAIGWHDAPRVRLPLPPGDNEILVESGANFFAAIVPEETASPAPPKIARENLVRRALGERATRILEEATRVEIFRVAPEQLKEDARKDTPNIGGYAITKRGEEKGRGYSTALAAIFLSDKTYQFTGDGTPLEMRCIFKPGVAFRFWRGEESLSILVCFPCSEVLLVPDNPNARLPLFDHKAHARLRPEILRLTKHGFPDDAEIQALKE